ncbi:MAG TPA: hypothetical protein VM093_00410 [Aeromicrobium sp.]|nr:hypothetical protein [Aeromicrobium sp.]
MSTHSWRRALTATVTLALALAPTASFGHGDELPGSKNAISRAPLSAGTADPTTRAEAAAALTAAEAQRAEIDPTLVPTSSATYRYHSLVPEDRYAMATGCYALRSLKNGHWVTRWDTAKYRATATTASAGEPFWFQATDLGRYLLWDSQRHFLSAADASLATAVDDPSPQTEWTAAQTSGGFTFAASSTRSLGTSPSGVIVTNARMPFALQKVPGCAKWADVSINVTGPAFGGKTPYQEVRGYVDAHTHGMAFEFLGGDAHCGRPWHRYGVAYALKDCPDHYLANGNGAILENFLRHGTPTGSHDPVGWPTFKDWPAPESLTHEGTYWKWLERSWRGGQRILVNLLVENNKLCEIYPLKRNSCDDMDAVRLQASDMRQLERYVDAQYGGPGRGFYRIVTDPFQARQVINSGRMAVVMGIETSVIFGCTKKLDVPGCTAAQIDARLDEVYNLGVRQMELVNKFDNALAGVAGDSGAIAPLVNGANFLETGTFWDMRSCPGTDGVSDRTQFTSAPSGTPAQDEIFGAIYQLYGTGAPTLPVYPSGPTCNSRGLTALGDHTIRRMVAKRMLFDPDHMSVKARQGSMDLIESLKYPGVVSSHSWSTPDAYPRIYKSGGFITPYAGDSAGFVSKWQRHLTWVDPRFYWAIGYGADINGFGAQGNPRGADATNPVTYPFTGLGGVTIDRQVSGQRTYNINTDGLAHYGLYPDWIEDLRRQGGAPIADDMARGSEAYLQMWERAAGIGNDGCRQSSVRKTEATVLGIPKGTSTLDVLKRAGIPHWRLGSLYQYCTKTSSGSLQKVRVNFDSAGKVSSVVKVS